MTHNEFLTKLADNFASGMAIVEKKNHDYAKDNDPFANFRSAEVIGLGLEEAILVRVLDKLSRIGNIIQRGEQKVKDESVADTLLDAINYLNILKVYVEHGENSGNDQVRFVGGGFAEDFRTGTEAEEYHDESFDNDARSDAEEELENRS